MITIKEEIAVPSPRERVWEVVSNPSDVVSCISGAELGAAHEDGSFDGTLVVRFGAIRVRFAARVRLELTESQFEGRLSATGGDGQGATRFRGEAAFRVVEGEEAGSSRVLMTGEVTLSGKLAPLVESGAGVMTSRMTKDFAAKLVTRCTGPAGQPTAPADALDTHAPGPDRVPVPAVAPPRAAWPSRCRAWLARLLRRRQPPQPTQPLRTPQPPAPDGGAPAVLSPRTTRTEEVGSDNAPAQ